MSQQFILSQDSLCRRVQYSDVWKIRFQQNIKRQKDNPTATRYIKSLSWAAHRFDSTAKPFSRAVVYLESYLATAQQVADERRGTTEGKAATAFLEGLDEEKCITLGNLADAGEETLALVRYLDVENFDKSKLAPEIHNFVSRIHELFCEKECITMATSFTRHVLNFLKKPRTIFTRDSVKVLGATPGTWALLWTGAWPAWPTGST